LNTYDYLRQQSFYFGALYRFARPIHCALTTALSITAMWMLAHKLIEQWHVWFVVNIISRALSDFYSVFNLQHCFCNRLLSMEKRIEKELRK